MHINSSIYETISKSVYNKNLDLLTKEENWQEERLSSPVKLEFQFIEDSLRHPLEVQGHGGKEAFLSRRRNTPLSDF